MTNTLDGLNERMRALAEEFLAAPFGPHSPDLQRLLYRLRGTPAHGKYVLVEVEPFQSWRLARLRGRGEPVELLARVFDDLAEAEREVFRLRCLEFAENGESRK